MNFNGYNNFLKLHSIMIIDYEILYKNKKTLLDFDGFVEILLRLCHIRYGYQDEYHISDLLKNLILELS